MRKKTKKEIDEEAGKNIIYRQCELPEQLRECSIITTTKSVILRTTYKKEDMNFLVAKAIKILEERL